MEQSITEASLAALVGAFYGKVREDALLGPVFEQAVKDWPHHLGKMTDFWSSVMLATGCYKGNPLMMHLKHLARIRPEMFNRWLELWRETAGELLDRAGAEGVIAKADRIAESLQFGMFFKLEPRCAAA